MTKKKDNILPEVKVVAKYPHEQRVINTMNASNAEFIRRLRNNDLRMMYSPTGHPSTHIMTSEDNYAFPFIQDRHGHLEDIRYHVPHRYWLDNSIENNDAIKFKTDGDARYFGEHYKKYFPKFFSYFGDNQYAEGGPKDRRGATPTRTPIGGNRFRLSDADEESSMSSEEIAEYNKKLEEENAEIARQDAERRAKDLEEARRNGTLKRTSFDKTLEALGEADRKMYQSAENSHSFDRLRRAQDSLSKGVNTDVATAKGLVDSAQQYSNEQMEKKQQQMRDIKKGFDATATALEMGAAGYTIGHLTVPRLVHTNTGWLSKVSDFFTNSNAQLGANAIGSLADGYQLLTADNKFDKYENGIELGGDTAGIVGGLDIVRDSNIFGRYSKPIDTALDTIGLSAATWDIAKNMPPFSYYYGKLKDYVNGTNETEDNQYAEGGEIEKPKHWKELSMADKADVMAAAVRNGVTTLEEIRKAWDDYADDSSYREDSGYRDYSDNRDYSNDSNDKDDNDYSDDSSYEEHQYLKGGYKPSASIKNRIANWEGSSMATNRSFEAEAKDFWNAIPSEVRNKLSQQQADALYSYSYNVGAGNFKRRVVPSLERYFNGNGSVVDVQRHMYAKQDSKLRGLAKRRAVERAMFAGQKVEDVPAVSYDYTAKSTSYSPLNFSINNNVQTVGYLGPVINNNANRTKQLMSVFDEEPKQQVIIDDTQEPAYNTLERLQNMYSMLGMDDYAQEIGNYNPFAGLTFAEGGKKATVYKNIDGGYTTANGHPVEQIGWDDNGYARFRDTVTGDIGKAYEPTDDYGITANRVINDLTPEQKADMFLKNYTLAQAVKDNQTISNDNLWIEDGRDKNPNLDYRGIVGGRANAAWEQEHPAMADWMYVANTIPFLAAGYPFAAGTSDAVMATQAGQAISGPLVDMAMQIGRSKWMPWADAVTTATSISHGVNQILNGNFTPETALEASPILRSIPRTVGIANNLKPQSIRNWVYVSKAPIGYGGKKDAIERFIDGITSGKPADIDNPWWFNMQQAKSLDEYAIYPKSISPVEKESYLQKFRENALKARADMWRMYNHIPQKYGTFTPSKLHKGAYTAEKAINDLKYIPNQIEGQPQSDFVTTVGGNIGIPEVRYLGWGKTPKDSHKQWGVTITKDWFDLHPFSRPDDRIIKRYIQPLFNKAISTPIKKLTGKIIETPKFDFLKPLEDKIANFEVGKLIGSHPVLVQYDIPWTHEAKFLQDANGNPIFKRTYTPGFQAEDLLPEPVRNWEMYYKMFNISAMENYSNTLLK